MKDYQQEFLDFAVATGVLRFGRFTLKSGRQSPYFFNTGLFNHGESLARLGRYYARAIIDCGDEFEMLYGPAYKGIPLVAAVAIALADHHGRDLPWCFNRKEAKDHGEGGQLVGAEPSGRVLIVDDVISAGLSVGESVNIISSAGARPAAVFVALNRNEKAGDAPVSAATRVTQRHGIPVYSIVGLHDLMEFLDLRGERESLGAIRDYYREYGAD